MSADGIERAVGAVVGTSAALPLQTAEQLRDHAERVLRSHDLRGMFESDLAERMQGRWNVKADVPTMVVEVRLQEFALSSTRDQRVRCSFKVNVAVVEQPIQQPWPGRHPGPQTRRVFEYVCPYSDLAAWLDESRGLVEASLAEASRYLAAEIVAALVGTR